ncbi:MAG: DsbA family protein [Actinobacteria bacterium]|nr:DsbA family protein [Actinomycetota bacterium]
MSNPKPTRSEQREAARNKAKQLREQSAKKEKRTKLIVQIAVVLVALGLVGGVAAVIAIEAANRADAPVVDEVPKNLTEFGGVKIGVGLQAFTDAKTPTADAAGEVPEIVVYVDYQCPICQAFDVPNSAQIRSWVDTGAATVEIRPISFLDRASLNEYSSRVANAAFCVANFVPDSYFDFHETMMLNQSEEGTEGHDNNALFAFAEEAGAGTEEVKGCIQAKSFGDYVAQHTQTVLNNPQDGIQVTGTPTILVNGLQYTWTTGDELVSAERFAQFVQVATAE